MPRRPGVSDFAAVSAAGDHPAMTVDSASMPTPLESPPFAVMWDMDGTLVDTEPDWIAAEYALVEEFGGHWDDGRAHSLIGLDRLAAAGVIRRLGSVDLQPEEIVHRLSAEVQDRIAHEPKWRPGAYELLDGLRRSEVPCALVTMSWAGLANSVVDHLPAGTFAAVVTGDVVTRGKPHPDPYLAAAARLGIEPAHGLAIEDSPTGVAAAVAAGVPTLAVPNVAGVAEQPGVVQVSTLADVRPHDLAALWAAARG
jgi:HAD superfamily hydrolase (TIGR01509 family)